MADAADSKSAAARRAGSSPAPGTTPQPINGRLRPTRRMRPRPARHPTGGNGRHESPELAEGELDLLAGVTDGIGEFHGRADRGTFVKT